MQTPELSCIQNARPVIVYDPGRILCRRIVISSSCICFLNSFEHRSPTFVFLVCWYRLIHVHSRISHRGSQWVIIFKVVHTKLSIEVVLYQNLTSIPITADKYSSNYILITWRFNNIESTSWALIQRRLYTTSCGQWEMGYTYTALQSQKAVSAYF